MSTAERRSEASGRPPARRGAAARRPVRPRGCARASADRRRARRGVWAVGHAAGTPRAGRRLGRAEGAGRAPRGVPRARWRCALASGASAVLAATLSVLRGAARSAQSVRGVSSATRHEFWSSCGEPGGRGLDGHGTAYVSSTIARPILEHPTTSYRLFSQICPSLARPEAPFTGLGKWSRTLSWTIVGALLSPYTMPKRKRARGDHGRPAPTEEPSVKGASMCAISSCFLRARAPRGV